MVSGGRVRIGGILIERVKSRAALVELHLVPWRSAAPSLQVAMGIDSCTMRAG
jgi:hypothetical protein